MRTFLFWFCIVIIFCMLVVTAYLARAESPSLTVAWDPNDPAELVAGYNIWWGFTGEQFSDFHKVDAGNVTTYTIEDLPAGRRIHVVATAYDAYGNESGYSDSVSSVMAIPGDLDNDGDVDGLDIVEFSKHYGMVADQ